MVAFQFSLLEPSGIKQAELEGDHTARLALQEEAKSLPFGVVWDAYCERKAVPIGENWLKEVRQYERNVLSQRQ